MQGPPQELPLQGEFVGGARGPVQLAELAVGLDQTLIDCRGQAEGRVNLQEEYVHLCRAASTRR